MLALRCNLQLLGLLLQQCMLPHFLAGHPALSCLLTFPVDMDAANTRRAGPRHFSGQADAVVMGECKTSSQPPCGVHDW
jgi:hypothetical protein